MRVLIVADALTLFSLGQAVAGALLAWAVVAWGSCSGLLLDLAENSADLT